MNFEDLQLIWNQQNERPLYALDHAAMTRWVQERGRSIGCRVNFEELIMVAALLIGAALLIASGIVKESPSKFITAGFMIAAAFYLSWWRRARRRIDMSFDDSLLGTIDRALNQIDHQVARLRSITWWLVVPYLLTVSLTFALEQRVWYHWAFAYLVIPLALWDARRQIRQRYLPRQKEFLALREKLRAAGE